MLKEDLEKAILYSNICLKRWSLNKTHLMNTDSIRSMVNGWLIRVLCRTSHTEWRMRKTLAKNISKSLFVTIHPDKYYITSITVRDFILPNINFEELHTQASQLVYNSLLPSNLNEFNLNSVQSIKFN